MHRIADRVYHVPGFRARSQIGARSFVGSDDAGWNGVNPGFVGDNAQVVARLSVCYSFLREFDRWLEMVSDFNLHQSEIPGRNMPLAFQKEIEC